MIDDSMRKLLQMALVNQSELNSTLLEAIRDNALIVQRLVTIMERDEEKRSHKDHTLLWRL